jgi:hypothetical protein
MRLACYASSSSPGQNGSEECNPTWIYYATSQKIPASEEAGFSDSTSFARMLWSGSSDPGLSAAFAATFPDATSSRLITLE